MVFRKQSIYTAFLVVLMALSTNVKATPVTQAEVAKIKRAHSVAVRVYSKTRDAQGAVNTLEESGIAKIIQKRPNGLAKEDYVTILNDYANFLMQLSKGFTKAEAILKKVTQLSPDLAIARLNLGDLYKKLDLASPNPINVSNYTREYRRYVELVTAQGLTTVLPTRVINAVYAAKNMDICSFITMLMDQYGEGEFTRLFNPETNISRLVRDQSGALSGGQQDVVFQNFANSGLGDIRRSYVDIDNDEKAELRYSNEVDGTECKRNVFYKNVAGKYQIMRNKLMEHYNSGTGVCQESQLHFLRYKSKNYFLDRQPGHIVVSLLNTAGQYQTVCELGQVAAPVAPAVAPQQNVPVQSAPAPVVPPQPTKQPQTTNQGAVTAPVYTSE